MLVSVRSKHNPWESAFHKRSTGPTGWGGGGPHTSLRRPRQGARRPRRIRANEGGGFRPKFGRDRGRQESRQGISLRQAKSALEELSGTALISLDSTKGNPGLRRVNLWGTLSRNAPGAP